MKIKETINGKEVLINIRKKLLAKNKKNNYQTKIPLQKMINP